MKKITLTLFASAAMLVSVAQDGNNNCVWSALNTYNTGGGPEDLERAIKCSDEAAVNETTAPKAKTWFYRGELYTLIFLDKNLKTKYPTSGFEGVKAFKRVYELNDPKFKDWDEVNKYLLPLGNAMFNEGVEQYNARNYAQAYQYFYSIKDVNAVLTGKGKQTAIDLATALKNAAACAENSGDVNAQINVYKDWLALAPDANAYRGLAIAQKKQGQKAEAEKTVDEGMAKFPKDANLVIEKLNFYLEDQKYVEALGYLNSLLAVDPANGQALFIKGLAYENEKILNEDSSLYYYNKAIEANMGKKASTEFSKPYNNIGALYVRKANAVNDKIAKLGNSAADQKKYDEYKKEQKDWFLKAKPFFEKAKEFAPDDALIAKNLKTIELYTQE